MDQILRSVPLKERERRALIRYVEKYSIDEITNGVSSSKKNESEELHDSDGENTFLRLLGGRYIPKSLVSQRIRCHPLG